MPGRPATAGPRYPARHRELPLAVGSSSISSWLVHRIALRGEARRQGALVGLALGRLHLLVLGLRRLLLPHLVAPAHGADRGADGGALARVAPDRAADRAHRRAARRAAERAGGGRRRRVLGCRGHGATGLLRRPPLALARVLRLLL